jgi:hypothetical protein
MEDILQEKEVSKKMKNRAEEKVRNIVPQKVVKEYNNLKKSIVQNNAILAITENNQYIVIASPIIGSIAKRIQNRQLASKKKPCD